MKIVKPYAEVIGNVDGSAILKHIELCGRVCYKSEDKITDGSAEKFVAGIIKRGHEAVLEHACITAKVVCDRGVSHEIVRHRLAAYCQESTRYCNYSGDKFGEEITVIEPSDAFGWDLSNADDYAAYQAWKQSTEQAERAYFNMLAHDAKPQEVRAVLPNSLKTEVMMTANLREWRHFFRLRTAPAAHPQMREVAISLLRQLQKLVPVVFDDISPEVQK